MFIGHLHSSKQQNLWKDFDAILIRKLYEDDSNDFWYTRYGKNSRTDERYKIYPEKQTYQDWYNISKHYNLVFLSINFDRYPYYIEFQKFTEKILSYYNRYRNNYIVGAGNETFEKRKSIDGVKQVIWDVAEANKKYNFPICFWNQKIRTPSEKIAFNQLIKDNLIQELCKYVGIQSLETPPSILDYYIKEAQNYGFEIVDVECGTTTSSLSTIEELFNINRNNGTDKIFFMCPYTNSILTNNYSKWKEYALSLLEGKVKKEKFKILAYAKQFIKKEKGMIADTYQFQDTNDKVIDWIQAQLIYQHYLPDDFDNFGIFDMETKLAAIEWQKVNKVASTGIVTKFHIFKMVEQSPHGADSAFRNLIIYAF